ncbi:hypothetical protein NDU88_003204 [Pleurodeles waltl]|uniref:Uncharacterized protein n=1 Tax=Pleurodeles waltl TaxID=8319 RepID=A0AAV7TQD3_PLEWA|nr:hypothetical protein NDU88_003204 [Pleurodeles waltl]
MIENRESLPTTSISYTKKGRSRQVTAGKQKHKKAGVGHPGREASEERDRGADEDVLERTRELLVPIRDERTGESREPFVPIGDGRTGETREPFVPIGDGRTGETREPFIPIGDGRTRETREPFVPIGDGRI